MGATIKSVQQFTYSMATSVTSVTQTIASVDPTKTVVLHLGAANATNNSTRAVMARLTDATTVTVERTLGSSSTSAGTFYVIEFGDGVTVQKLAADTGLTSSATLSISAVDLTRTVLFFSCTGAGTNTGPTSIPIAPYLLNATTVAFQAGSGSATKYELFVLEFD